MARVENLRFYDQSNQVDFLFLASYFLKEIENMFPAFLSSYRKTRDFWLLFESAPTLTVLLKRL